jgi:hypothetical protein
MFKKLIKKYNQLEQNVPYRRQDSDQEVNLLRGKEKKVNLNQVD